MNDTRSEIIRLGSELIRSIGYNSFSYADISKALNIKNAAIHYYFPSKSDLGVEIIRKNLNAFNELIEHGKVWIINRSFPITFICMIVLSIIIGLYSWLTFTIL